MSDDKRQKGHKSRSSSRNQKRGGYNRRRDNRDRRSNDYNDRRRSGPPGKPRIDEKDNKLVIYVRSPPRFADDVIRGDYVEPAIEKLNEGKVEEIIFKARGKAINVAVRAVLLLEEIVGVMRRTIKISSSMIEDRGSKGKDDARIISSMEIKCCPW
ncbi:MAG: hypothetical protein ACFFCS_29990 [Candidatus Hodarchaeota archaeon]